MNKYAVSVILAAAMLLTVFPAVSPCHAADSGPNSRIINDWMLQDHGKDIAQCFTSARDCQIESKMLASVLAETPNPKLQAELKSLTGSKVAGKDPRWRALYVKACQARRAARLTNLLKMTKKIVFTKHYNMGGSHYAYTEGLSDAQSERHFKPGSALCIWEMEGSKAKITTLIDDPKGVIRDPDVSYDGKRVLFSWKKSDRKDDYHLYEMDLARRKIKQLTTGLGFADYEGCYLPDGNIMFNSTRCVQTVDCWWTEVSNLYICDAQGKHMRRVGFDQVHSNYPQVLADGRVIYTRWDYNDRGQLYPQPLYQMNIDGTAQTEYYGNNSWFPTTIAHARGIPGSDKLIALASGHHSIQAGALILIDVNKGRQETSGATLVAPLVTDKKDRRYRRVDGYTGFNGHFMYPYAINETEYVASYSASQTRRDSMNGYGVYYVRQDAARELLVDDPKISCNQPVFLIPRKVPPIRPSTVDYTKTTGTYYVQDIYFGPGLKGVERGTVKKLRVVALDFRAAGVGSNNNGGPGGGALVSTPIAINNGTWDVKTVLGQADVYPDGSAFFEVPARTPLYFQAIDAKGDVVQSMRSWSTLMPGEKFSCIGCHESKSAASPAGKTTRAMTAGPKKLTPFYGSPQGFSFPKIIQPILDKHCIKCHFDRDSGPTNMSAIGGKKATIPTSCSHVHSGDGPAALSDGLEPKKSSDHSIPRFTWWDHRGSKEWVQYNFKAPSKVTAVNVYWFDDTGRGACRTPASWRLMHRDGGKWKPVSNASTFGVEKDKYNCVTFDAVTTDALRLEVQLEKKFSGGILEWKVTRETGGDLKLAKPKDVPKLPKGVKKAFSLLGKTTTDKRAGRNWSDSYLVLTRKGRPNNIVNWLNVQSIPPMLPPYFAGACKSSLMTQLRKGHNNVKLSREELDKIACWIDLLVPYCGDYMEANAWPESGVKKYEHFLKKRKAMEAIEQQNIKALQNKATR
ncbi:MAG: hypothetical protein HN350_00115 [Phycisphaerales bacterium]|jgi:hypothetical protein|nr:hypothetical protein [Phycisphaerales bacterium]